MDRRKGSVYLCLKPPMTKQREQFDAREVASAERARIELKPLAVDGRYDQKSERGQNPL